MEVVPGVAVEFNTCVDNLHCGLYDGRRIMRVLGEMARRERMEEILDRVSMILKEVAMDQGLPLAEDKEESVVLRSKFGRRGRRGVVEKLK